MNWFFKWLADDKQKILLYEKKKNEDHSFSVRLKEKDILDKLDRIASSSGYTRNDLINIVLKKFVDEAEIMKSEEETMLSYFKGLDQYLYATIGGEILIAIGREELGRERNRYTLINYELSIKNHFLRLEMEKDDNYYEKIFTNIYDIRYNDLEGRLKTWIYMREVNWRFYLFYNIEKMRNLSVDFETGKLIT